MPVMPLATTPDIMTELGVWGATEQKRQLRVTRRVPQPQSEADLPFCAYRPCLTYSHHVHRKTIMRKTRRPAASHIDWNALINLLTAIVTLIVTIHGALAK
jgi:hypothetical protein